MSDPKPRSRWPSLFQQSTRPLFVLNRSRRIRFVNEAWEKLTKTRGDDALGRACIRKGPTEPLYRVFAPPPEAIAGRVTTVRRAVPPNKGGPPWWDITFIPLTAADGAGYLGVIDVAAPSPQLPSRSVPAALGILRAKQSEPFTLELFDDTTPDGKRLCAKLRHAACSEAPIWITGEPGSGKSTAARVIHHIGPRRDRPFITIDCAGLQPYLIDGLLWGTGGLSAPHRVGTLHLKNPESLPRDLQQKVADWVLQNTDAPRVICTSVLSTLSLSKDHLIIDDIATSLSVIELNLPPLRERLAELPPLLANFGVTPQDELLAMLRAYSWPENIREFRQVLAEAQSRAGAVPITAEHLPRLIREKSLATPAVATVKTPSLDAVLERVEAKMIAHALTTSRGNQTEAAAKLGIFRARLIRRIAALGIK